VNKTIWTYWENRKGASKPAYLDLCIETVRRHSPSYDVVVLDERSVRDRLPDLREDIFRTREIAHRADYIRARTVYEYGGIWLDSDIVLLNQIDADEALATHDFVGCGIEYGKPSIWFFAANKGARLLERWIEGMDEVLDRKKRNPLSIIRGYRLKWLELAYDILWKLSDGYDYYHYDFKRFAPIRWDDWEKFFSEDIEPREVVDDETIAVMLYNKFMFEPLRKASREEVLASDTLLGKLFRLSLQDEE
jgi:hypothetical protein